MNEPTVSIIMSVIGRPLNLKNALIGWSLINYPNVKDFTIVDNASANVELETIVKGFQNKVKFPVRWVNEPQGKIINQVWNKYGKAAEGEYVLFTMMDEIISHPDIIQKMLATSSEARTSIFTYFMDLRRTMSIEDCDWHSDPTRIPLPPTDQTTAGLISHITGNYKENWEYFGWFRDIMGHLWIDQDVHLREIVLGPKFHCRTPKDVYCLHQFHTTNWPSDFMQPGYRYKTVEQARLLEPAERGD
jgi:hypothetical protein